MSKVLTSTATAVRYCRVDNGSPTWYTPGSTVSVSGVNDYGVMTIGQWAMNPTGLKASSIKKITLYIYVDNRSSLLTTKPYVGCSSVKSNYNSVTATGVKIEVPYVVGWQSFDVTRLKNYIASFDSTWYLLLGADDETTAILTVSGTSNMLYLEIEYSDGSKIYLASGGSLIPYTLYRAENGSLVPYDIYRAENGSLVKY